MAARIKPQTLFARAPDLRAELTRRTVRERISDKLASLVASGILQVGDELPSERELAALLAVSRETVRGAIQTLAAMGVVAVSQGARTRVISQRIESLKIGVTSPSAINSYDLEVRAQRAAAGGARGRRGSGCANRRCDAGAARAIAGDPEADVRATPCIS